MKPFATWNLNDDTVRWHGQVPRGCQRYRVELWARNERETNNRTITPDQAVEFHQLLADVIATEIDELFNETQNLTAAGFRVYRWN